MEEDEEPEFPVELDELLEYCIGEHGDDFEAISKDFLDIAADLEEPLAERAHEFFSPDALRRRWALLCEAAGVPASEAFPAPDDGRPEAPAARAPEAAASAAAGDASPQASRAGDVAPPAEPPRRRLVDDILEPQPSTFSIFKDSLKGQIDMIYSNVQNHLPSATTDDDDSEEEGKGGAESSAAPAAPSPGPMSPVMEEQLARAGSPPQGTTSGSEKDYPQFDSDTEELRQQTMRLFGTTDLRAILKSDEVRAASVAAMAADPASETSDDASVSPLARGVAASAARAAAEPTSAPSRPGIAPAVAVGAREAAPAEDAEADSGNEGSSSGRSCDSLDEDFAAARRAMKSSSIDLVKNTDGAASKAAPKKPAFAPPPRGAARPSAPAPGRTQQQTFVKLELVESSGEEEESVEADESEGELEAEGGLGVDLDDHESIVVTAQLLKRAPNGECPWDTWLDMARRWPRLQVKLGSPDFFRRGDDLRVRFDVALLREVHEEAKREGEARRQKQAADEEKLRTGAAEFIQEAERRREMMGGRFSGGFVLTPSRRSQSHREREEEEKRLREEAQAAEAEARERQHREEEAQERARVAEERRQEREEAAARAKEERRREEEARALEARGEALLAEALQHRCPLTDRSSTFGTALPAVAAGAEEAALYAVPWGAPGGACCDGPEAEQREALGLLHARGAARALLLVSVPTIAAMGAAPECLSAYAMVVLVLLSALPGLLQERLPCGRSLAEMAAPLPWATFGPVFQRPLALWASEHATEGSGAMPPGLEVETEMVCVALRAGSGSPEALAAVLEEAYDEGLAVVGLRMAFPDDSVAQTVTSAAMRNAIRDGRPVLLVAFRGPHALNIWRSMLGPADPALARRTDPASLNARFGGETRAETLSLTPPSSAARALADVAWAFGGRIAGAPAAAPVHAVHVAAPSAFAVEFRGRLSFPAAGAALSGILLRLGQVVSLAVAGDRLLAVGVREGGAAFLASCGRLMTAPDLDRTGRIDGPTRSLTSGAQSLAGRASPTARDAPALAARPCELPPRLGLALCGEARAPPAILEEACRLGEPEVLVLGLRPSGGEDMPLLLCDVLDGLCARFGPGGRSATGRVLSAGLHVGGAVDLVSVRIVDFGLMAAAHDTVPQSALAALRSFRNFSQAMGRTPPSASEGWWMPQGPSGPTIFLCLRGDGLVGRYTAFLCKEWKLPAATGGSVLFTPTVRDARQAFVALFAGSGASVFQPSLPPGDLRALSRFQAVGRAEPAVLSDAALFPQKLAPQLTVALVVPPKLEGVFGRALGACDHNEFSVVAAVMSGGLRRPTARALYEQEVADDHLEADEWEAFAASVGCAPEECEDDSAEADDEGEFRCIWLILSRHQAVKRFAQLCGHSDPAVNQEYLHPSIRSGRDRVRNGVRCATSCASAEALLGALERDLGPALAESPVWPPQRSLGLEDSERFLECTLLVFAMPQGLGISLAHLLRDAQYALADQGLVVVGLRAWDAQAAPGAWPRAEPTGGAVQRWCEGRPAAAAVGEAALRGGRVVLIACEGAVACERARRAALATAAATGGQASAQTPPSVVWYASACAGEAVADVAYFFAELRGAKHYVIVEGEA